MSKRLLLAISVGLFLAGCQGAATPTAPDAKALEKEGERLRKEHQKEMSNK